MDKKWIITRQGKDFVLYEGLLDEAHQQGLKRIATTLIQIPHDDNGNVAVCQAEVETTKGTFSGIGDASPGNVNRMIAPHLIRMAETRAKARALRDAVNIGVSAVEELGDDGTDPNDERSGGDEVSRQREYNRQQRAEVRDPPAPKDSGSGISEPQRRKILALCGSLHEEPPPDLDTLSKSEASHIISGLESRQGVRK